jgi:hypothetical protein
MYSGLMGHIDKRDPVAMLGEAPGLDAPARGTTRLDEPTAFGSL